MDVRVPFYIIVCLCYAFVWVCLSIRIVFVQFIPICIATLSMGMKVNWAHQLYHFISAYSLTGVIIPATPIGCLSTSSLFDLIGDGMISP